MSDVENASKEPGNDPGKDPGPDGASSEGGAAGERRRVGPKRSEASTAAVIQAAYVELSEHGWRGFSVDRVAKSARASKQTIYRWWKTPACLAVQSVLSRLPAAQPPAGDPRERIRALIEPLLVAVRTGDGAHAWRAALLAAADDTEAGAVFRAWFMETIKLPMRQILAEMAMKNTIRRDYDIDLAAELLFGPVWHRLIAMRGPVPEVYSRRLVEAMIRALAPG
ncbi:MAG: TetR/AcrR family transcriptional regulator [Hyphomonadaceae bacterium]